MYKRGTAAHGSLPLPQNHSGEAVLPSLTKGDTGTEVVSPQPETRAYRKTAEERVRDSLFLANRKSSEERDIQTSR